MQNHYSKRQLVIGGIFILFIFLYLIRLFTLQVLESEYRLSADNNVLRYTVEFPARGEIFDRNGELLVYNERLYDLMVIPKQLKEFDTLELSELLGITLENFKEELQKAKDYSIYKPSIVFKQISLLRYATLQEKMIKYSGFYMQERTTRKYPLSIAAHVLGYVGEVNTQMIEEDSYYNSGDYVGISGIEKAYEKYLRGVKGLNIYLVDVYNRIKGSYKEGKYDSAAVVGNNITTTLDAALQQYGELLMKNKRGSIVAIEPSTGEILAFVSSPTYDPNLLTASERGTNYKMLLNDSLKPLFNRALMACYPPGSTFKLVDALIGLEEEVITTESAFSCGGGFNIGSHIVKCHHGGSIDFLRSISGSCNSYYCNVFTKILKDDKFETVEDAYKNWREHVMSFGLGRKLNSDLENELAGIIYDSDYYNKYYGKGKWGPFTIISMAIGQGELGFTPFQMANMVSTIANRGYYIIPHTVKAIDGVQHIDSTYIEKHYVDIDTQYFSPVIEGMRLVVESGTARSAWVEGITICGKTGTAQNPHGEDHSIFVAFAPLDKPQIVITVYVENGGFGSTWAAPIASLMIEKYLTDTITRPWVEEKMLNSDLISNP
jgi:penicillin-binding protein 2